MRRALATALTLGLLSGFVFVVVLGLLLAFGAVDLLVAVAAVVVFEALLLLVSPRLNDFLYRWLYDLEWVSLAALRDRSPASAAVIGEVTAEHGYGAPKLGIIPDGNPTAFTYGTGRFNARIVLTEGCFEYLDDGETASVVAHELGHVTSRDFVVMTLANTLVQVLYLIAVHAWRIAALAATEQRRGPNNRANPATLLYGVAALSYLLWFLGEYIVLYLSRVREYAADRFAAEYTEPDLLSGALVKIAYGIVTSGDSTELARATRNIGIMNVADSRDEGLIYHATGGDSDLLLRSFLFDLYNPWAKLLELRSTHPLTGKRIRALSELPGAERFDFDDITERLTVDRGRLYRDFARDVAYLVLPLGIALGFPAVYLGSVLLTPQEFSGFQLAGGWLTAFGIGMAALALYKYPRSEPEETTVLELLADVYASPVRGRPVALAGELIGRGQAGYRFSEDLMFEDRTGLMYLQYESWLPGLGNLLFSVRRVPELVGEEVAVDGWFVRGMSPSTTLRELRAGDETVRGYAHVGGLVGGGLLVAVGVAVILAGMVL